MRHPAPYPRPGENETNDEESITVMGLGVSELVLILVLALIFFGPGRLPEIGQAMGRAVAGFRGALSPESRD